MTSLASNAERIFAEAIEMPPGEARAKLVIARCGNNTVLAGEVESLLRAHDNARGFLSPPPPRSTIRIEVPLAATQGTAVMNPAAHADAFLHASANPTAEEIEKFTAKLPEAVRQETRERIEAGLRVRQFRDRDPPAFRTDG